IPSGGPEAGLRQEGPVTPVRRPAAVAATVAQDSAHFIAGPPITRPASFFGREREVRRIFGLWQRPPLQNAAVIGPRGGGKTSLLMYLRSVATAGRLRPGQRGDFLRDPQRYRFVFADFQDPRLGTREGLLRHLLQELGLPASGTCSLENFIDL